jgi:hypothetical protein
MLEFLRACLVTRMRFTHQWTQPSPSLGAGNTTYFSQNFDKIWRNLEHSSRIPQTGIKMKMRALDKKLASSSVPQTRLAAGMAQFHVWRPRPSPTHRVRPVCRTRATSDMVQGGPPLS